MIRTFSRAVLLGTVCVRLACPQGAHTPPDWSASLARIRSIAQHPCDRGKQPACETVDLTRKVAAGLAGNWSHTAGWQRPSLPGEYAANLDRLAGDMESISNQANGPDDPRLDRAVAFTNKDLQAKLDDCLKFGMGRVLLVTVRTLLADRVPDPGWEVFFTCSLGGQAGSEIRAGLTETTVRLPPSAICTFRARKAGREVRADQVGLFGQDRFSVEITVP